MIFEKTQFQFFLLGQVYSVRPYCSFLENNLAIQLLMKGKELIF